MTTFGYSANRFLQVFDIEEVCESRDAMGGTVKNWVTFAAGVRGQIRHLSSRELMAAGQVQSEVKARGMIRHRKGVSAKMRINDNGTIYSIEAVIDRQGNQRTMELDLSQGVNDG